jgi:hypothetical protein
MLIKMIVPKVTADRWAAVLEYAENGMADANLQDIVEGFGKDADKRFELLIEDYGMESACRIESWWRSENEFELIIISPDKTHKVAFIEFLKSFGASNISEREDFDW